MTTLAMGLMLELSPNLSNRARATLPAIAAHLSTARHLRSPMHNRFPSSAHVRASAILRKVSMSTAALRIHSWRLRVDVLTNSEFTTVALSLQTPPCVAEAVRRAPPHVGELQVCLVARFNQDITTIRRSVTSQCVLQADNAKLVALDTTHIDKGRTLRC